MSKISLVAAVLVVLSAARGQETHDFSHDSVVIPYTQIVDTSLLPGRCDAGQLLRLLNSDVVLSCLPDGQHWQVLDAPTAVNSQPSGNCSVANRREIYLGAEYYCLPSVAGSMAGTWVSLSGGGGGGGTTCPTTTNLLAGNGVAGGCIDSTKAPPSGAIVGTTDTQSLTNKTLDGVSPATMGFVDPTSSVQTQLNGKEVSSNKGATSGYAPLDGSALVPLANIPTPLTGKQAATAAALASVPSQCFGQFSTGIGANGNANCAPMNLLAGTLASIPGTCTVGVSLYQATDQPLGLQLYACTATNTWTREGYSQGTSGSILGTCSVGQVYFATDATAGQNWYFCTATNTWTQQLNSGGGSGCTASGASGVLQASNGSGGCQATNISQDADGSDKASKALTWAAPSTPTYNAGATTTCDWSLSNVCSITMSGGNTTLALTNPHGSGPYRIIWTQDTTPRTVTYPGTVKGGIAPDATSGAITVQGFTFDGTNYQGTEASVPSATWHGITAPPVIFSNLPSCLASYSGSLAMVSDSNTTVLGATVAGSGSNVVGAFCNGSNWVVAFVASGTATPQGTAGGDLSGTYPNPTVSKVNGNTPGATCTAQFVRSLNSSAVPTCASIGTSDLPGTGAVTVNSATCTLGSACAPYGGTNVYTASHTVNGSGTVNTTDTGKLIVMNCSSPCTLTFEASPVVTDWWGVESIGSTVAALSLNGKNFNGSASVPVLNSDRGIRVSSDGSNYFGDAPFAAGTGIALTPAANAFTLASSTAATRRTCTIDNDTQSATVLVAANFSGHCVIPADSTIVEVDVAGGAQVITGTATAISPSGTSSVQIGKYTPNGGTSTASLLSAALATASGKACALTSTSGTCINGTTSSGTVTISTTALAAGDILQVSAATADGVQTWYNVTVIYTIN